MSTGSPRNGTSKSYADVNRCSGASAGCSVGDSTSPWAALGSTVPQRARLLSKTARRSVAVMDMLESRELVGEQGWSDAEQSSIPGPCLWARPSDRRRRPKYVTGNNKTP